MHDNMTCLAVELQIGSKLVHKGGDVNNINNYQTFRGMLTYGQTIFMYNKIKVKCMD